MSCIRLLFILCLLTLQAGASELYLNIPQQDEQMVIVVDEQQTLADVKGMIEKIVGVPTENMAIIANGRVAPDREEASSYDEIYVVYDESMMVRGVDGSRDYYAPLSKKEWNDIHFIVTTLANTSLPKLWGKQRALEAAGDRVDHVHPLKFLLCIFTDEEMKACMNVIKDRSWVWKEFVNGLSGSLQKEYDRHNMREEYLVNFTNTVDVDLNLIIPYVDNHQWTKMITTLIKYVPREGNPSRYDM